MKTARKLFANSAWSLCKRFYLRGAMPTKAGIIVIGDEILKGQTQDTNSFHLCKLLRSVGVDVRRTLVIGDNVDEIATEIRNFSNSFDVVLTTGGIGPTHDDVTFEAVGKAFSEEVFPHPQLVELCKKIFGEKPMDSPEMKLAHVPMNSILHFGYNESTKEKLKYPIVSVNNVYVFPGVPSLLEKSSSNLKHLFMSKDSFYSSEIMVDAFETKIATIITSCVQKYSEKGVTFGSYPDFTNNYYKVKIIVESTSEEIMKEAVQDLRNSLPHVVGDEYVKDPVSLNGQDVYDVIRDSDCNGFASRVKKSVEVIEEALDRYQPHEVTLGFNGGKDCTGILHIYNAVLRRKFPDKDLHPQVLYIHETDPFEEMTRFMDNTCERYKTNPIILEGSIKPALANLKVAHPHIKAIIMGTRDTDPNSHHLFPFAMTDEGWPQYMRINPILEWTYRDIWTFLRSLYIPYCVLYDRGYTSIGSRGTTKRNEKLIDRDPNNGLLVYKPAYLLQEGMLERTGRL